MKTIKRVAGIVLCGWAAVTAQAQYMIENFESYSSGATPPTNRWYITSGVNVPIVTTDAASDGTKSMISSWAVSPTYYHGVGGLVNDDGYQTISWGPAFVVTNNTGSFTFNLYGGSKTFSASNRKLSATGLAIWDVAAGDYVSGTFTPRSSDGNSYAATQTISLSGLTPGKTYMPVLFDLRSSDWGKIGLDAFAAPTGTVDTNTTFRHHKVYRAYGFDTAGDFETWSGPSNFGISGSSAAYRYTDLSGTMTSSKGLLTSNIGGDGPTGTASTPTFTLQGDIIEFRIAGGNGGASSTLKGVGSNPYSLGLELVRASDNAVLRWAVAQNDSEMCLDYWSVKDLIGTDVYLRVRDASSGGWGWLAVDAIREVGFFSIHGDTTASWKTDNGGFWAVDGNWEGGLSALGATGTAYFTNTITAARTISNDVVQTINSLVFSNANFGRTIAGEALHLAGTSPTITVGTNIATISSVITGTVGFVKAGGGTLLLSGTGANTYSGTATVNGGVLDLNRTGNAIPGDLTINANGKVFLSANNQIADGAAVTVNGGTLDLNNKTDTINTLTMIAGAVQTGSGTLTVGGNITGNASATTATISGNLNLGGASRTFTIADGSAATDMQVSAVVANGSVVKAGAGLLEFTGANLYAGGTTINGGTLQISANNNLGAASGGLTLSGGALRLAANLTSSRSVTVTGTGTLDTQGNNGTFTTAIGGTGVLVKEGSGTLTLTANNTYSGGTVINAGRLSLTGTLASGVTVNSGGTLQGSGRVNGTISGAGFLNPGASPGILTASQFDPTGGADAGFEFTATGDPTWSNAGASVNDVLRLTHSTTPFTANLDSSNTLDIYFNVATLAAGDTFRGGFFTDRNSDFTLAVDNATYNFYVFGDGGGSIVFNGVNYYTLAQYNANNSTAWGVTRSVVQVPSANFSGGTILNGWVQQFQIMDTASVVPEPSTMFLLGVGAAMLYRRLRRNRTA
ncbi:MAG: autotransporter-associated beta strand repeat-containing protein [Verrucomicrobiae bacterium]|nr:autotransporter-associated beta strand repeat-containing protein [Verrucomicrobiae bacterium]